MSEEQTGESAAPFALIILKTLRVVRFQTKEEFFDAMKTLNERKTKFIGFKYHHGAGTYVMPEIYEPGGGLF